MFKVFKALKVVNQKEKSRKVAIFLCSLNHSFFDLNSLFHLLVFFLKCTRQKRIKSQKRNVKDNSRFPDVTDNDYHLGIVISVNDLFLRQFKVFKVYLYSLYYLNISHLRR